MERFTRGKKIDILQTVASIREIFRKCVCFWESSANVLKYDKILEVCERENIEREKLSDSEVLWGHNAITVAINKPQWCAVLQGNMRILLRNSTPASENAFSKQAIYFRTEVIITYGPFFSWISSPPSDTKMTPYNPACAA